MKTRISHARQSAGRCRRGPARAARIAAALALAWSWSPISANETDQFLLPSDKAFADLGRYFSATHYDVLSTVADQLNRQIRCAKEIPGPAERRARLDSLHSPRRLADMVREEFGPAFFET